MRNMLDAVNNRTICICKNDIAVLSHDLNDQLLPAQVTHLIEVF